MNETPKVSNNRKSERGQWDHRFAFESDPLGTKSLPKLKAPKPYVSRNGSVVKSVLKTNARGNKRKKVKADSLHGSDLKVVVCSLTPVQKKLSKRPDVKNSSISVRQRGKIKSLRSKARPCSLPLLRKVQSSTPIGMEKSYSARDSTSTAAMLQIDVTCDNNIEFVKDGGRWQKLNEITEDCNGSCGPNPLKRLCCIGRGSSAYVYKSILLPSLEVVADKVVVVASREKSGQIMQELQSLRTLLNDGRKHPYCKNIVRLLEVYPNPRDGTISICLEYMDGGSLQDVVSAGGCQDEIVLAGLSRQILCGISFLHSHRHIHRDIKPGNILLSAGVLGSGQALVKISDFGISKELEKGHSLADSFLGTFHYMSPERIAGKDYSFSSDIWGCGLSILAVAMGCYPFSKKKYKVTSSVQNPSETLGRKDRAEGGNNCNDFDCSGGYWRILQAISHRPPLSKMLGSDNSFSSQFRNFLSQSLHRDKDLRASADVLLTHMFLTPEMTHEGGRIHERKAVNCILDLDATVEHDVMKDFINRCCQGHREQVEQRYWPSTAGIFPAINRTGSSSLLVNDEGVFFLDNLNIALVHKGKSMDGLRANYTPEYYDEAIADDFKTFFSVFLAYKQFLVGHWGREEMWDKSDMHTCSAYVNDLQCLLESTLAGGDNECVQVSTEIKLSNFPSAVRPLFDCVTYQKLSKQLRIPLRIIKVCFRDLILELLGLMSTCANVFGEKSLATTDQCEEGDYADPIDSALNCIKLNDDILEGECSSTRDTVLEMDNDPSTRCVAKTHDKELPSDMISKKISSNCENHCRDNNASPTEDNYDSDFES